MSSTPLNIVLADDDEDDRLFFGEALEQMALQVRLSLYKNGQELMDFLNLPQVILPNLIFLDLNMPVKNGMECLCEIRETPKLRDLSVAIYSTSSSEKDIEETYVNGANIYIKKPNNFTKLCHTVEKVLQIDWQVHRLSLSRDTFLMHI